MDDKKSFLNTALLELDARIKPKTFFNPKELIKHLKNNDSHDNFVNKLLLSLNDKESDREFECENIEHSLVDIDVFGVHKKVYDVHRFDETIVVVVDYAMPGMNGLEVCQALDGLPYHFIMLTGEAKPETALKGFNAELIHRFIRKESSGFIHELESAIHDLQLQYFQELSAPIIKTLSTSASSALGDPDFIRFFSEFCPKNEIVEYYLVSESGCFLMFDIDGNPSWLAVKNDKELDYYYHIAVDNLASTEIINSLKNREKLLFLLTREDEMHVPVEKWIEYMYPVQKIEGRHSNYYYAYIKMSKNYNQNLKKILSYKDFLLKG